VSRVGNLHQGCKFFAMVIDSFLKVYNSNPGFSQGVERRKTYWVVVLKTRRCYNFPQHMVQMFSKVDSGEAKGSKKKNSTVCIDMY
jgi:hypothetical protein